MYNKLKIWNDILNLDFFENKFIDYQVIMMHCMRYHV